VKTAMIAIILSASAYADTTLYHTAERPMVDIAVPLRIWQNPYSMCRMSIYDVQPGEILDIDGFAQVDAPGLPVGVTTFVNVCDPTCKGLDPSDGSSFYGGGNVGHRSGHHQRSRPAAWYEATTYQPEIKLSVVVMTYSNKADLSPLRVSAEACGLKVLRINN
jgi:hypothetical protein